MGNAIKPFDQIFRLDHPRERVYARWISPDTLIAPATELAIDARVGGIYRLIIADGFAATGVFSEVEANRRLVYSWQWDGDAEVSRVEVEFGGIGNTTELRILHREFRSQASLDNHAAGWLNYIEGLRADLSASG